MTLEHERNRQGVRIKTNQYKQTSRLWCFNWKSSKTRRNPVPLVLSAPDCQLQRGSKVAFRNYMAAVRSVSPKATW